MADYLNDRGVGGERQGVGGVLRLDLVLVSQLFLHQLSRAQSVVQRAYQIRSKPVLPDVHGRIEVVSLRPQLRALFPFHCRIFPGLVMNGRTSIDVPFQ